MASRFTALPKDVAKEMKATGVWQEGSPVPLERLSLLTIPYTDFEGNSHNDGELIALDVFAEHITEVFSELYKLRFPIHKMRGAHHYGGDDELSMADNNTSCFCYRPIADGTLISIHAYGLAVDINPLQNPFIVFDEGSGASKIYPQKGWEFSNRHNQKTGMVEEIVPLLAEHGFFIWGGRWTTPIDYHHFQPQRGIAELLTILTFDDGKRFIDSTIRHKKRLPALSSMPNGERLQPLIDLYRKNKTDFFDQWIDHIS